MASFQIEWKNSALKELQKLPRQIVSRVVAAVDELSTDPFPQGVRKLVASEYSYRIRVGEARHIQCVSKQVGDRDRACAPP